ncbi:importin subunit alpha-4 [Anaeramoeba flamelloides]|uniref:Importin subunit alpha n=1 Tax=Anaeramoeba flamelloides TaxID=1746091 RepID=A0AAV7ZL69_9EUKA|nr:importin subunit alpha-4 [Anaeramoeba flamelloides]
MTNFEKKLAMRQTLFKKKSTKDSNIKKRIECIISYSKNKRENNLMKRRNIQVTSKNEKSSLKKEFDLKEALNRLPQIVNQLSCENPQLQFQATQQIRMILAIETDPPIDQVVSYDIIPTLVNFLRQSKNEALQFEAAWTLTNIASGTSKHTELIVKSNTIPVFVELIRSSNEKTQEQAIWALGNIAGDCVEYRDLVLSFDTVNYLICIIRTTKNLSLKRNAAWSLSNLCRGKPSPDFEMIKKVLPILLELLKTQVKLIIIDACWSLAHLSSNSLINIQTILDANICPILAKLIKMESPEIRAPVLRCIGNLVTGNHKQTQMVLDCNILSSLKGLLLIGSTFFRTETCWALSNICAGTYQQIQMVIEAGFLPCLKNIIMNDSFPVQKQAGWALANMIDGGLKSQIRYLANNGAIPQLCNMLLINDGLILKVTLAAIEKVLKIGEDDAQKNGFIQNKYIICFEESDGFQKIDKLQNHSNRSVSMLATYLCYGYFSDDSDGDDDYDSDDDDQEDFGMENGQNIFKTFFQQNKPTISILNYPKKEL